MMMTAVVVVVVVVVVDVDVVDVVVVFVFVHTHYHRQHKPTTQPLNTPPTPSLPSLLSRRTGSNTIHGACHVKQGIKYVAQRWIRWHTTQTPGFNPLQRALDQSHHLSRSLQEQERIAAASGSDQTKHLLTKVTNYESNIHSLKKEVDQLKRTTQDLNTRIRDLGDSVPLHVTPSNRASLWRTWVTSSVLFLPVLNNIQQSIGSIVCLFHGDEQ
jgi:hypothetical protein